MIDKEEVLKVIEEVRQKWLKETADFFKSIHPHQFKTHTILKELKEKISSIIKK